MTGKGPLPREGLMMNRMSIACTPPKLGSQWGLRYLSPQTTGQHCLSVELIAHPDDLCIKREISTAVSYIHLNSFNAFEDLVTFWPGDALQKKIRENVRIFLNRPAFDRQEAEDTVHFLCNTAVLHKKSVFPLHSLTRKDKQRGTRMCTLYFQERPGNIYHHRITITIVTTIDGEVHKRGLRSPS